MGVDHVFSITWVFKMHVHTVSSYQDHSTRAWEWDVQVLLKQRAYFFLHALNTGSAGSPEMMMKGTANSMLYIIYKKYHCTRAYNSTRVFFFIFSIGA